MGNVNSIYDGCFGVEATKPQAQQTTEAKPKTQELKTDVYDCSTEAASSVKKISDESDHFNKKKVTIKDFNLIKVLFSNAIFV